MTPLTGLEGAFTRGRLLSGMVCEDILEYARVGSIFEKLEPKWAQAEMDKLQFGKAPHGDYDRDVNPEQEPSLITPHVSPGQYKRVWHRPIFGLFNSNSKWIPTTFVPLTFEFTLQDGAQWMDTTPREKHILGACGIEMYGECA